MTLWSNTRYEILRTNYCIIVSEHVTNASFVPVPRKTGKGHQMYSSTLQGVSGLLTEDADHDNRHREHDQPLPSPPAGFARYAPPREVCGRGSWSHHAVALSLPFAGLHLALLTRWEFRKSLLCRTRLSLLYRSS